LSILSIVNFKALSFSAFDIIVVFLVPPNLLIQQS
jgi:hypothetical protein